jgi:hypothetical protein
LARSNQHGLFNFCIIFQLYNHVSIKLNLKIHKFDRFDFFETNLIPALKANHSDLLKNIEQYESKFNEIKERLEKVRVEKIKMKEKELESKIRSDVFF